MTISKAYGLLAMEGLLERKRGVGLFVARIQERRKSHAKARLLEQSLDRGVAAAVQMDIPAEEVYEIMRRLFETHGSRSRRD